MERHSVAGLEAGVARPQPIDEFAHLAIAPHPYGKSGESRPLGGRYPAVTHIVIDARGIRPITLDGDEAKSLLLDQLARDPLTHAIKLRRSMRGFAQENHACVTDPAQHGFEIDGLDRCKFLAGFR